ncbi:hypothetical protein Xsto_02634 [Xenorhabdus stockiae]|uniref:Uncharacterized protein n=1 Tax=Xenorhabdus stockiae TaxID=351614 RepID=A0A2D0KMW7_9GAMM|nr:hypothetical protein [Xenorhabdus stockiae]PHM64752.1 hypothetical protein Xsto_02634 [Xenorhabdus stockiae]
MFDSNYLAAPIIAGYDHNKLYNQGKTEFCVEIPYYEYAQSGDKIIFYVNGIPTQYQYVLNSVEDLGTPCIYQLPFGIFLPVDTPCRFSYTVQSQGNSKLRPSNDLIVTYTGKSEPSLFGACTVYSSFGINDDNNIIEPYSLDCGGENGRNAVTCHTISNYKKNPEGAGLYIVINGENYTPGKVPIGSQVELFATLVSECYQMGLGVPFSIGKKVMKPDASNPDLGRVVFPIPHDYVVGYKNQYGCQDVNGYEFGYGTINFSYTVNDHYESDPWKGRIFTCGTDPSLGIQTLTSCTKVQPCYNCPE